jgi:hypothetical protein
MSVKTKKKLIKRKKEKIVLETSIYGECSGKEVERDRKGYRPDRQQSGEKAWRDAYGN